MSSCAGHSHGHKGHHHHHHHDHAHSKCGGHENLKDKDTDVECHSLLSKGSRASKHSSTTSKGKTSDCFLTDDKAFKERLDRGRAALSQLCMITGICFMFMILEFVGGYISNSMAIMTDAAHMLSDASAFMISIASILAARWSPSQTHSYGYHRTEVLGAILSIIIIWVLVAWLIIEAIVRCDKLIHGHKIEFDAWVMLITSIVSLVCNIVNLIVIGHCSCGGGHSHGVLDSVTSVFKPHGGHCTHDHGHGDHDHHHHHHHHDHELKQVGHSKDGFVPAVSDENHSHHSHGHHHHHDHNHGHHHHHHDHDHTHNNINVQAAIVHLIGDLLQSIGVIIAAIIIMFKPDWMIVDPICTFLFSVLVMFTTIPTFIQCTHYLMECTPTEVRTDMIRAEILALPEVAEIHDFHVWGLAGDKYLLSAHILLCQDAVANLTSGGLKQLDVSRDGEDAEG